MAGIACHAGGDIRCGISGAMEGRGREVNKRALAWDADNRSVVLLIKK